MKLIRKRRGFLDGFQKQDRTISVGIIGAIPGCGVTTMAVAMANYLAGITKKRVAVYEHNSKRTFNRMKEYFGESDIIHYHRCTYYPKGSIQLSTLYNEGFNIVIVDFGTEKVNISELMRCTYRVAMGSLEPWNYHMYNEFINMVEEVRGSDTWFWIVNGDNKAVKKHKKSKGIHMVKRPFIDNPFIIDNSLVGFFEALF